MQANVAKIEAVSPANTAYCHFTINPLTTLLPRTAKHIAVTINDKYAVTVKSIGKNIARVYDTPYNAKYYPDSGLLVQKTSANTTQSKAKVQLYKQGTYITTVIGDRTPGKHSTKIQKTESFDVISVAFNGDVEDAFVRFFVGDVKNGEYLYCSFNYTSNSLNNGVIEDIMITMDENTNFDFVPYQFAYAGIPLTHPLYDGDYVYIKNGDLWIHRENEVAVFDGSEDWRLNNGASNENDYFSYVIGDFGYVLSGAELCNVFLRASIALANTNTGFCVVNSDTLKVCRVVVRPGSDISSESSQEAFKAWLRSNPMTVVYKLAAPTEEKIVSAEPYTLRTADVQTTIWTPDDLQPEIQVDVPKNLAGGYALDGYAQAKRNEAMMADLDYTELTQFKNKVETWVKNNFRSKADKVLSTEVTYNGQTLDAAIKSGEFKGDKGADGAAATIEVGTVTTGAAGSSATVTNVGSSSAAKFNFAIPRGETGATGPQGPKGETGATGPQGPKGDTGDLGDLPTFSINEEGHLIATYK